MDNANSREYLDKIRIQVIENLKRTTFAPSVQMQDVPRDSMAMNDEDEAALDDLDEDENTDKRHTQRRFDNHIEKGGELSESEDEEMNHANGVRKQPGTRKRRNRMDYRNLGQLNDSGMDSNTVTPQQGSSGPDNDVDEEMTLDDARLSEPDGVETPSPVGITNGSAAASGDQSSNGADSCNDVTMEDAIAQAGAADQTPAQSTAHQAATPPDTPLEHHVAAQPAPTGPECSDEAEPAVKAETIAEGQAIAAQEGHAEREEMTIKGEALGEVAPNMVDPS